MIGDVVQTARSMASGHESHTNNTAGEKAGPMLRAVLQQQLGGGSSDMA